MSAPGLRSRDLSALFAFGSVAISGALPLPVLVLFPVALVLSLAGLRPLAGRRGTAAAALLVVAVGFTIAVIFGTLDLVIAAVSFATLVTAHRMLAEPTPQASRQVLLAGLLLVAGGAALTGEVLFAVFLVAFFFTASWSLAWLVLAQDSALVEKAERRAINQQLAVGTVITLVMGLAFFVFFPRLSWNLASRRGAPGLGGVTGLSDTVRLGGGGDIKTNARVAFRVSLTPDPGSALLGAYWVGRRFDAFDGTQWRSSGVAERPEQTVLVLRTKGGRNRVTQEFEVTSAYGSRTLVALDTPTFFGRTRGLSVSGSQPMALLHVPGDQVYAALDANGFLYTAESDTTLAAATTPPTEAMTALPQLDPRLSALADELSGGAQDPMAAANALEAQLKRRYAYTLELPGEVRDPLADFLFSRRAGHCEDFATALAVMLRLKRIPARVVTGFFGGERAGARYVVRAGDAHAWVEAFIDGRWHRFDATPDDGRAASSTAWKAIVTGWWERLEEWWRLRVVDYSFQTQLSFARQLVRPPPDAGGDDAGGQRRALPWKSVIACTLIGVLALLLARRRRAPKPHPAASFLSEIEAGLVAAHVAGAATTPLEELVAALSAERHPLARAATAACRRYLAARYGGATLEPRERAELLAALETPRR